MSGPFAQPQSAGILYATDLSPHADRALGHAVRLARAWDADIVVLHVSVPLPPNADLLLAALEGCAGVAAVREKSALRMQERVRSRMERLWGETVGQHTPASRFRIRDVIVETGDAAERIVYHARTGAYDALVLGFRGYGLLSWLIRGATVRKVLNDCPIPIFVVNGRTPPAQRVASNIGATNAANAR